ncbi:G-box-binding factor 4, partial [Mucuna pruriens]
MASPNPDVWDEGTECEDMSMSMNLALQDLLTSVTRNDGVLGLGLGLDPDGRGKKRAVEEAVVDKATLQKQKRMIKNRESAARSRERKQAYTVELESLVTHLEEENAQLLTEEADRKRQRFNQLMECLIPVAEKRKPRRMLRRVNSVQW